MGHITAEKQSPSAIDFVGTVRSAIDLERRMSAKSAQPRATKDMLNKIAADYTRMVTLKKHRIDGAKKALCYNMFPGNQVLVWKN